MLTKVSCTEADINGRSLAKLCMSYECDQSCKGVCIKLKYGDSAKFDILRYQFCFKLCRAERVMSKDRKEPSAQLNGRWPVLIAYNIICSERDIMDSLSLHAMISPMHLLKVQQSCRTLSTCNVIQIVLTLCKTRNRAAVWLKSRPMITYVQK